MSIDHPDFIETKLHNRKITSISISNNLEILYTSSEDGSIFISSISGLSNYYKGPGATALKTCYADVNSCFPALFLALTNGSNYLSTIINGYDSEDTNISDSINSLPN